NFWQKYFWVEKNTGVRNQKTEYLILHLPSHQKAFPISALFYPPDVRLTTYDLITDFCNLFAKLMN
ncbi:MAG TPA: hypothetical protein V6D09_14460, partial [Leptolyngbyaceae cyanobacterium]